MTLDGKVALVTGAAQGIGRVIAKRFLEAAGRVVIADLNEDEAAATARELGSAKDIISVKIDVTKQDPEVALLFAAFPMNALTGQSLVVSHGWYMN